MALTPAGGDAAASEKKMLKSLDAGLAKVMSKMGISVVDSYRDAHLFDILGLHQSVVDRCFLNTPAPLSGIGFEELEVHLRADLGNLQALLLLLQPIFLIMDGLGSERRIWLNLTRGSRLR